MNNLKEIHCDVAIIGGGPTGLAAATTLKKAGVKRVIVLEREAEAGGIPRHCGHPPFGIREYRRVMSGPVYAKRIKESARASGVEFLLKTTVTQLLPKGQISIVSTDGPQMVTARRVLLATGTRETPRSARFVSGGRPLGIYTTGALQSMVYLKNMIPFQRPLVVGTEIVSFSALMTCKKAGIKPVAMVEAKQKPSVAWPVYHAARFFGVPLYLDTRIVEIIGNERVRAVRIETCNKKQQTMDCDGVLFTGQFTPESSLARMSHLELDPATGSPVVDQFGCCSDPAYYAAGNVMHHPVKVAGKCWDRGNKTAQSILRDF